MFHSHQHQALKRKRDEDYESGPNFVNQNNKSRRLNQDYQQMNKDETVPESSDTESDEKNEELIVVHDVQIDNGSPTSEAASNNEESEKTRIGKHFRPE